MEKLSKIQKEIVTAPEAKIVVLAAAAAGKTKILTERVRYLLKRGEDPSKVLVITFTNAAANELRTRLGEDYKDGLQIYTVHAYANKRLNEYRINTKKIIEDEEFDELFKLVKENSYVLEPIEHLLLDEAQDSSLDQFEFILDYIKPKNYFLVGDLRQAIYTYADADPWKLETISRTPGVKTYSLNENYRNSYEILSYAAQVVERTGVDDDSIPMRDVAGETIYIPYDLNRVAREIKKDKPYRDWFVLCRTNAQVSELMRVLTDNGVPCSTFQKKDLDRKKFDKIMASNTVKVITIHACVSGDTLVYTQEGHKTIKEVVEKRDHNNLVYNGTNFDRVKHFIDNGLEKTFTITTKYGNNLRVTGNHRCVVLTEKGEKKITADKLLGDEELLLRKGLPEIENKITLKQIPKSDLYHNVIIYDTPKYLTKELGELVGMITADGTSNAVSIHYNKRHKECCDRFAELIYILFKKKIEVKRDPQKNMWLVECNSRHIKEFLYQNFEGLTNRKKKISSKILESTPDIQRSFLKGLFEDGAVHLKKGQFDHICLTFKNDEMVVQLQTLLLSLGIDPVFRKYSSQRNINSCQIYSNGAESFKKIGFITPEKQNRLITHTAKRQIKNKSSSLGRMLLNSGLKIPFKGSEKNNLKRNYNLTEQLFNTLYSRMDEKLRRDQVISYIKYIFDNYQIEPISRITENEAEPTYCLEMTNKDEFLQNGFLMGNSKGLEQSKVVVVGANMYNAEELRVSYVAITRARDKLVWVKKPKGRKRIF